MDLLLTDFRISWLFFGVSLSVRAAVVASSDNAAASTGAAAASFVTLWNHPTQVQPTSPLKIFVCFLAAFLLANFLATLCFVFYL